MLQPARRLEGFDYSSAGAYFVTICADYKQSLFENSHLAEILHEEWDALPARFPRVLLDEFVIMPNHVHFVIWFLEYDEPSSRPTLSDVVAAFKSRVAVRWLRLVKATTPGTSARVRQRNFYERVVRNDAELDRIREYIRSNPLKWTLDRDSPGRKTDVEYEHEWDWLEKPGRDSA